MGREALRRRFGKGVQPGGVEQQPAVTEPVPARQSLLAVSTSSCEPFGQPHLDHHGKDLGFIGQGEPRRQQPFENPRALGRQPLPDFVPVAPAAGDLLFLSASSGALDLRLNRSSWLNSRPRFALLVQRLREFALQAGDRLVLDECRDLPLTLPVALVFLLSRLRASGFKLAAQGFGDSARDGGPTSV